MNIHGERYATDDLFVAYCRDLNLKTDEKELEYYEKIGAIFPVARVVYPSEYVIRMHRHEFDGDGDLEWLTDWPDAIRLDNRVILSSPQNEETSEEVLVHRIDREFEAGNNTCLFRPDGTGFRPWSEFVVTVDDRPDKELERSTAEHYYSYWQVHQLYFIRRFSGLYQGAQPIDPLPNWLPEFDGNRRCFDALSLWISAYHRERERTFSSIPASNGFKKLSEKQATGYKNRLSKLANEVTERFGMSFKDLYRFLYRLVEIHDGYRQDERYRLAEALEQDIFACEHLLQMLTGETREQIADHLADYKQTFRHLSIVTKERDYALMILNQDSQRCAAELQALGCSVAPFTEADANDLLNYCDQEGLGLLPYALSGMNAIGFEEFRQKSRRMLRYTNLKNILTGYEYFLKNLGPQPVKNANGLTQAVEQAMQSKSWFSMFKTSKCDTNGKRLLSGTDAEEFLDNLDTLLEDNRLEGSVKGYWARQFLVTCLARNMTVHSYPSDDRYYGDLSSPMLHAVIMAMLYTWKMAQREGWI